MRCDQELTRIYFNVSGIDLPRPGGKPSARVQEVGRRLTQFAKLWNVPFEFQALADKWESITPAQLMLKHDEVLAVNCQYRLRNLLDESIMAASPRKIVLDRIRSMNPKVRVSMKFIRLRAEEPNAFYVVSEVAILDLQVYLNSPSNYSDCFMCFWCIIWYLLF